MSIFSIQIFKKCSGCGERFDDCVCPPEYVLEVCAGICWHYGTDKCPFGAEEAPKREVGRCIELSAKPMTKEQLDNLDDLLDSYENKKDVIPGICLVEDRDGNRD